MRDIYISITIVIALITSISTAIVSIASSNYYRVDFIHESSDYMSNGNVTGDDIETYFTYIKSAVNSAYNDGLVAAYGSNYPLRLTTDYTTLTSLDSDILYITDNSSILILVSGVVYSINYNKNELILIPTAFSPSIFEFYSNNISVDLVHQPPDNQPLKLAILASPFSGITYYAKWYEYATEEAEPPLNPDLEIISLTDELVKRGVQDIVYLDFYPEHPGEPQYGDLTKPGYFTIEVVGPYIEYSSIYSCPAISPAMASYITDKLFTKKDNVNGPTIKHVIDKMLSDPNDNIGMYISKCGVVADYIINVLKGIYTNKVRRIGYIGDPNLTIVKVPQDDNGNIGGGHHHPPGTNPLPMSLPSLIYRSHIASDNIGIRKW